MRATDYMKAAIDNAVLREAELAQQFPTHTAGHASGFAETPQGEVGVHFVSATSRVRIAPEHMRKMWKLNGKRISADKLKAVLDAKPASS